MTKLLPLFQVFFGLVFALAPMASAQQPPAQISFSARAVQTQPDQPDEIGMIYKSGSDMRLEFTQGQTEIIQVLRPTLGIARVFDVASHTYTEIKSPPQPAQMIDAYTTPCPPASQQSCERVGVETVSGVETEIWSLASPDQPAMMIWWDSARRHALRQQYPDGSLMQMQFIGMENVYGRDAEHWTVSYTTPDQPDISGGWWFDPVLRLVVQENLPDGTTRHLEDIRVGPLDPALFEVPQGWQPVQPPNR